MRARGNPFTLSRRSLALKKTHLFLVVKVAVSSILLYVVFIKTGIGQIFSLLKGMHPAAFVSATVLFIVAQFCSTLRWKLLLPVDIGTKTLFSLYMIGSFFNTLLPGLIGGDAVKAYYLYQATGKGGLSLASTFMDRYIGFAMLIALGIIAFPFGISYFHGSPVEWVLPLIVIGFVGSSFLIFGLRLGKRFRTLSELYEYFHSYRNKKRTLIKALLISGLVQILGISAVYILALGMGEHIPYLACLIFLPIIILFTTLPISISGIGVREGAFVFFFGLVGVAPGVAAAISLSWFMTVTAGSLFGFVEYMRYKKGKPDLSGINAGK
jgi:uncharacterized protein (TIRG00374 family)